jgi:formylmethanofuran dehydrogenase subunit E
MDDLEKTLIVLSTQRRHFCPRQVLGARIGLAGAAALELPTHRHDRRLIAIVEMDGCFADAVEAATGCSVGHRTLRVADYGKVAATFIDRRTETAVRLAPRPGIRLLARDYAPEETKLYYAQLAGYQRMPLETLLDIQTVSLNDSLQKWISRAGVRVNCQMCGEEILNEREVVIDGRVICLSCAGDSYYTVVKDNRGSWLA